MSNTVKRLYELAALHFLKEAARWQTVKPDDHSEVVPLLPFPNRTVKRLSADDSAGSRVKVGHCQATIRKALVERRGLFAFMGSQFVASLALVLAKGSRAVDVLSNECLRGSEAVYLATSTAGRATSVMSICRVGVNDSLGLRRRQVSQCINRG